MDDNLNKKSRETINNLIPSVDDKMLEDSKLWEQAQRVHRLDVVNEMFNYRIFRFKLDEAAMFMMLNDQVKEFIKEFIDN